MIKIKNIFLLHLPANALRLHFLHSHLVKIPFLTPIYFSDHCYSVILDSAATHHKLFTYCFKSHNYGSQFSPQEIKCCFGKG